MQDFKIEEIGGKKNRVKEKVGLFKRDKGNSPLCQHGALLVPGITGERGETL